MWNLDSSEIHRNNPLLGASTKTGGGEATTGKLALVLALVLALELVLVLVWVSFVTDNADDDVVVNVELVVLVVVVVEVVVFLVFKRNHESTITANNVVFPVAGGPYNTPPYPTLLTSKIFRRASF